MASTKKSSVRGMPIRRFFSIVSVILLGVVLAISFLKSNSVGNSGTADEYIDDFQMNSSASERRWRRLEQLKRTHTSVSMEKRNRLPRRNTDLYPNLSKDRIIVVLYVHNRPQYLRIVVESLSRVTGINETLLVVSHDGYFEDMNGIAEGIRFCQVKQIIAPYSPHLFPDSFPGASPGDCKGKAGAAQKGCSGTADQYGNYRSPKIVSLKHHWWWMMNAVWDGLEETRKHPGDILFIEEDHFVFPNAYRNMQVLISLKTLKCPDCYATNLAPLDVQSKGEGRKSLIAERMGNVGYAFNRSVWRKIHRKSREFCRFDDYNWDITMWATVFPSFGRPVYTLRAPRRSAAHFGKCGLHQGQEEGDCVIHGEVKVGVEATDAVVNIEEDWDVHFLTHQAGYRAGFRGWGGWGDFRDHQLCLSFASMHRPALRQ